MKNKNHRDDVSKVIGKGFTRWHAQQDGYIQGVKVTPHGIVDIYCQDADGYLAITRLDFVWKGVLYMRNWEQCFSKKKVAQLCNEFAKEIANRRPRQ